MQSSKLSQRPSLRFRNGEAHHLWLKRGRFYFRFSVAIGPFKAHRRECIALRTSDFAQACTARDALISEITGGIPSQQRLELKCSDESKSRKGAL